MKSEELALVQGWGHTKDSLRLWRSRPSLVLRPWFAGSALVAMLLLIATWIVSLLSTPDTTPLFIAGVSGPADAGDYGYVLIRNGLVLLLHAMACVAGFIAGSSMPVVAEGYTGFYRKLHDWAQPFAIGFVVLATLFSLCTQAYILGGDASTIANQFGVSPGEYLLTLSLHAIPELTALFLPLAAWTMASRRKEWENLLAATFVTTAIAIPIILAAAAVEVWVTPRLLTHLITGGW